MTTSSHPKLARIRALLAKAEATNFPEENETYNAKARALIAEYGIDEALAFAEGKTRDTVGMREIVIEGPYAMDKRTLMHRIYSPLGTKTIHMNGAALTSDGRWLEKGEVLVKVYGYDSDLDRAELLYTSLLIQALSGMQDAPKGHTARNTMANRRAWLAGFGAVVFERLTDAERGAQEAAQDAATEAGVSTALVLADRSTAVEAAFKANHSTITQRRTSYRGHGGAQGRAAGRRADIGGKRVGGTRTAIR